MMASSAPDCSRAASTAGSASASMRCKMQEGQGHHRRRRWQPQGQRRLPAVHHRLLPRGSAKQPHTALQHSAVLPSAATHTATQLPATCAPRTASPSLSWAHLHYMLCRADRLLAHAVKGPDGYAPGCRPPQPPGAPSGVFNVGRRRAAQPWFAAHAPRQQGHGSGGAHILRQQGTRVGIPQPPGVRCVRGLVEPALRSRARAAQG